MCFDLQSLIINYFIYNALFCLTQQMHLYMSQIPAVVNYLLAFNLVGKEIQNSSISSAFLLP